MFLDVGLYREEIRVDEVCDSFIRVRLGFQPSTGASSRSRAEVEKDRTARLLRLSQSGIDVFAPLNCHSSILDRPPRYRLRDSLKAQSAARLS
jgi:hypothetical protein